MLARSDPSGKNRTRPSTAIYRMLMIEFERQRLARGLSMAQVDDLAGTQDGFYSKMLYPDTPFGRQSRWETVQDVADALFGRDFSISVKAEKELMPSMVGIDKGASSNALKNRHWRHTRHFRELGAKGGKAYHANTDPKKLSAAQRRAARIRWRKIRKAKRQGQLHRDASAGKKVRGRPRMRRGKKHEAGSDSCVQCQAVLWV